MITKKCLSILLLFSLINQCKIPDEHIVDIKGPNFVIIIVDDLRYDALGIVQENLEQEGRFPWLQTPNIDQLAHEGMRFSNAFVVTSLCSPSRAAILTGNYGHLNGIINNDTEFQGHSFVHTLQKKGYHTGYFGKWHMGSQTGPLKGFDVFKSYVNQGSYYDCQFIIDGKPVTMEGWVDDQSTDLALDYIWENEDRPFCCIIGYKSAHNPWNTPPDRTKGLYNNAMIRDPISAHNPPPYESVNQYTREEYEALYAKYDLKYFEIISALDYNIGKIIYELKTIGIEENTVIIFMSDNGLYLGEHGLRDKRTAYKESIQIPLIIKYPPLVRPNSVNDNIVLNIDIAPTILDLADVASDHLMQGNSLAPLFTDQNITWRDSFLYEYIEEPNYGPRVSVFALQNQNAKLIKYLGNENWTELFDLKNDPYETRNLYNHEDYQELAKTMEENFNIVVRETGFEFILKFLDKN